MRNELRIWSEHLAGPPAPPRLFRGRPPRRGRFAGSREKWRLRRGSRGVEQAAEVPVHLGEGGGGEEGVEGQAEDGPGSGRQCSVKSFCLAEHSSGVSGGSVVLTPRLISRLPFA